MTKIYHVYMILNDDKKQKKISYVGYTNNLIKRIQKHNNNAGAKFTKGRKWILIYSKSYKNKSEALKEEYKLKKDNKLRKTIKYKYLKNKKK